MPRRKRPKGPDAKSKPRRMRGLSWTGSRKVPLTKLAAKPELDEYLPPREWDEAHGRGGRL